MFVALQLLLLLFFKVGLILRNSSTKKKSYPFSSTDVDFIILHLNVWRHLDYILLNTILLLLNYAE